VLIKKLLLIFFLNLFFSTNIFAHSGGLDSNGGHLDKRQDFYHCHSDFCDPKKKLKKTPFKEKGYDRKKWSHWIDIDRDCQNTRAEILIFESILPIKFRGNKKCSVFSGKWHDPYSGRYWFLASDLDIDHIVPLYWAYNHGGKNWTNKKKSIFANDIDNLLAVEDELNQSKGSKGPNNWLPPNKSFQCIYVKKFDKIVEKYKLIYRIEEKLFINHFLDNCYKYM
jgi:hypothetical protein